MKLNLEVNNTTNSPVEDGFFEVVAEKTFDRIGYDFLAGKELGISVALVTPEEIKRLNKEYRKYDCVTDVLSFPEFQNSQELKDASQKNEGEGLFLGELILCYDDIKEYALCEGREMDKELAKVVSHGILHLAGFSHGKEMFGVQEEVAADCP